MCGCARQLGNGDSEVLPSKSTDANTLAEFMPVGTFGYAQPYGRVPDQSISWEEPPKSHTMFISAHGYYSS